MTARLEGLMTTVIFAAMVVLVLVGIAIWSVLFFGPAH